MIHNWINRSLKEPLTHFICAGTAINPAINIVGLMPVSIKNSIEIYHRGAKPRETKAHRRRLCRAINRQDNDINCRAKVQIGIPLNFVALTDHAEYLGLAKMISKGKGTNIFFEIIKAVNTNKPNNYFNKNAIRKNLWQEIIDAAGRHNDPEKFTTLIDWEWPSIPK